MNDKIHKELEALISLLGDEDKRIQAIARAKLMERSALARPLLQEVAHSDSEGRVRIQAQALLEEIRLEALAEEFRTLLSGRAFDLERACFILARIEYPNLDARKYVQKLDRLAREALISAGDIRGEKPRVQSLNRFLFEEMGFRGNHEAYYDPQNSFMNRVLDRYLGIPISLSALYLFVARRLNLPVYGVGFPGHFLVKYQHESERFYIDAFNKGKILSRADCADILESQGYDFYDSYLSSSTPKEILARMIRNLVLIYHENHQPNKIDALERIFSDFFVKRKEEGLS